MEILSINPINRHGNVEADAKMLKLTFKVLVGRDSDIIKDYQLTALPKLFIVDKQGKFSYIGKFARSEELKAHLDKLMEGNESGD